MKKPFLLVFIQIVTIGFVFSQSINLVPNSSFEEFSQCPDANGQIYYAVPWTAGTGSGSSGSSDFIHCCSVEPDILFNIYNIQYPRTGCGESSIILFGNEILDNYREFLEIELKESLNANKKYCGKFYISLNNYANYAIENIGMFFSPTEVIQTSSADSLLFSHIPQIENINGILKDTLNWVKISGSFIASGDEKYLVIGNFYPNKLTNYLYLGGTSNPRYFVDDVSVCDCDDFKPQLNKDTTLCIGQQLLLKANVPKEADSIIYTWQDGSKDSTYLVKQPGTYWVSAYIEDYKITVRDTITVNYTDCSVTTPQLWIPNSFTPNGDGINDKFEYGNAALYEIKTYIYNRWGQLIFEGENTDYWDGTFKGKPVQMDVYNYKIEAIDKTSNEKKVYSGRVTVVR